MTIGTENNREPEEPPAAFSVGIMMIALGVILGFYVVYRAWGFTALMGALAIWLMILGLTLCYFEINRYGR